MASPRADAGRVVAAVHTLVTGGTATSAHRVIVPALASSTGETAVEAAARVSGVLRGVTTTGVLLVMGSGVSRSVTTTGVRLVMVSGVSRSVTTTGVRLAMVSGALRSVMVTGVRLATESVARADVRDHRAVVLRRETLMTGTSGCGRATASLPAATAMRARMKKN
ncbi:hypothetical protein [Paramicrobacterium agarici]|uniref:hypothetical protein n=1 Tax=Paramicrobacterium agarici TaxID=630514 RepID=UPI001180F037|nr:hypothetical protein [Microbacterium agarici]